MVREYDNEKTLRQAVQEIQDRLGVQFRRELL
jgi:hypothetical protein